MRWLLGFALAFMAHAAGAQTQTGCVNATPCVQTNVFTPLAATTLAASNVSASVAIPSAGPLLTLVVSNPASVVVYLVECLTSSCVATSANIPLQPHGTPGSIVALPIGLNTYVAALAASSTATLVVQTGTGVPLITASALSGSGSGLAPTSTLPHNTVQSTLLSGTAYVEGY